MTEVLWGAAQTVPTDLWWQVCSLGRQGREYVRGLVRRLAGQPVRFQLA